MKNYIYTVDSVDINWVEDNYERGEVSNVVASTDLDPNFGGYVYQTEDIYSLLNFLDEYIDVRSSYGRGHLQANSTILVDDENNVSNFRIYLTLLAPTAGSDAHPTPSEIEAWRKGEINLYNRNVDISVSITQDASLTVKEISDKLGILVYSKGGELMDSDTEFEYNRGGDVNDDLEQLEEASDMVNTAANLVEDVVPPSLMSNYRAYGRYGFDQLLGKGNPYDKGLDDIGQAIEESYNYEEGEEYAKGGDIDRDYKMINVGRSSVFTSGFKIYPEALKVGKIYEWTTGAQPLYVRYLGLTKDLNIRSSSSVGSDKYKFQFVGPGETNRYIGLSGTAVRQGNVVQVKNIEELIKEETLSEIKDYEKFIRKAKRAKDNNQIDRLTKKLNEYKSFYKSIDKLNQYAKGGDVEKVNIKKEIKKLADYYDDIIEVSDVEVYVNDYVEDENVSSYGYMFWWNAEDQECGIGYQNIPGSRESDDPCKTADDFISYINQNTSYAKGGDVYTGKDVTMMAARGKSLKKVKKSSKGGKTDDNWIQDVTEDMEKDGTEGAFTKQAKRHEMTPIQFAKKVLKNPKKFSLKTRRRAQFVKNVNPEKFYEGGNISQVSKVGDPDYPTYEL